MKQINYIVDTIEKLVNIPSPSGFTKEVMNFVQQEAEGFGYQCNYLQKGGLVIDVPGKRKTITGVSAHADTLGAMVRSISANGTLRFSSVGGYTMESIEGEYCKVHTREGKTYTGTVLSKSPAVHTYDDAKSLERKEKNMEVRLDERAATKEEVLALGINSGDYISFEPRFEHTKTGYIKSRHLDDKASVAILLALLKEWSEQKVVPENTLKFIITNYEETGTGASYLPEGIEEFIAVDMGAVGDDLNGNEYSVSVCAMDSTGPYDYELTTRLATLAKEKKVAFVFDIFPHYGSDASAAMRGGNNIRTALIGQGIHASHGMERTHEEGLSATWDLLNEFFRKQW